MNWLEEKPVLEQLIENGVSMIDIGKRYNVSRQRMYQVFTKYNIKTHSNVKDNYLRGRPPEDYWLMKMLHHKTKDKVARLAIFEELTPMPIVCPVFGVTLDYSDKSVGTRNDASPSIDRIDSSKGYIPGNCAVICWGANRVKNNGTTVEHKLIYEWMERLGV